MNTTDERRLNSLVSDVITARPLPATYAELDSKTRDHIDIQAAKAGLTPDAYYTLGRARAKLTPGERHADNYRQRATPAPSDPAAIVAAIRK